MSRRVVFNLVWFTFVAAMFLVWAVNNIVSVDALERPYRIRAEFASSVGLQPNAEVAYLGVAYGRVSGVESITGGVRVTMAIDREKKIPENATASIWRKSAIGEQYVDLFPPDDFDGGDGPWMAKDTLIPMERTTVPLEFSELLRSASRLIEGIPPEDVDRLISELATGLSGRTESLRQLAIAGDQVGQTLADRTEVLDRLATNNTRLTRVVTQHRGSLGQSLTDLRQVADALARAKGDLAVLLDDGAPLVKQLADVVAHQKGNLDCDLKVLEQLIDETTTPERLQGLRTLLQLTQVSFGQLFQARDLEADGTIWARVGFLDNRSHPAPQFTPAKQLPAVPAVPACTSTLKPTTLNFAPAARSSPAPAGSGALLLVLLGLVAGVAVVRETVGLRSTR